MCQHFVRDFRAWFASFLLIAGFAPALSASAESNFALPAGITLMGREDGIRSSIGVTRTGTSIPCLITPSDLDPFTAKHRILVVAGVDGDPDTVRAALEAWGNAGDEDEIALSLVPCVRPDETGTGQPDPLAFPPGGPAYNDPDNDVAHYLWRWIGMHAPDEVMVVASARRPGAESLVAALASHPPCDTGTIPARIVAPRELARAIEESVPGEVSPARREFRRRVGRSPIEVATELAAVYGRQLDAVHYIPALAVAGRMRWGELSGETVALQESEALGLPFLSGEKSSLPSRRINGSVVSGHLVFAELARRTGDAAWIDLVRIAADTGFDEGGRPRESMPFHNEMSDAVFMGCAILAEAGALSGEQDYFAHCLRHLRFIEKLCLREDGLYRHSPLDETAWGRGNGFPALGMALSLSALPEESPEHDAFLASYRAHLSALREHQDPTGAWHQVIDHEESYREFTCTCMITFAIVRGMRRGWLDREEWQPVVDRAWTAIQSRIGPGGSLVDVCTGTGKQRSLRDYFDRTAILGRDDRGGAMALLVSTELAYWERERNP